MPRPHRSRRRYGRTFSAMNSTASNVESRAAAYLAKLPPAVAGNAGHHATFAAACRLVEFGLSFERALPLLAAWNQTHCQPRWTEADLRHKLADAFKRTSPKAPYATVTRPATFRPISLMSTPRKVSQTAPYRILERRSASNPAPVPVFGIAALIQRLLDPPEIYAATSKALELAAQRGLSTTGLMAAWSR